MSEPSESIAGRHQPLLKAVSFAARAHRHQLRKDRETPYAAHPFRVCLIVRHVFGIDDPHMLMAALLHDTIEDTTTDRDDLIEQFGAKVADWVAALSKDGRLAEPEREEAYMRTLAAAPPAVKICKLADMYDNLIDSQHLSGDKKQKTIQRLRGYLACLKSGLPDAARAAFQMVERLLVETEAPVH